MTPIVTCTVSEKCVPVLSASIESYCPGVRLIVHKGEKTTFGEAFNKALDEAFLTYDEVIACNDDVVLTPTAYQRLLEDVAHLKGQHGDKLGLVAAHTDSAFPVQNIRFQNSGGMDRYRCQWTWEGEVREEPVVAPIFAWMSKKAWEAAKFPPINWFSDDVICRDLGKAGFKHFVSRAYVHHVGSQTVGHDDGANAAAAEPWIRTNRPDYANMWFGAPPEPAVTEAKPLKICVYAISKNEEKFVERFCLSAKDADLVLIADTNSTDKTREVARSCGAQVHNITISPWRFDHARNAALSLVPEHYDVCVSIDLDEVLEPGWRQEIERLWKNGVTRLRYLYDWGGGVRFKYEKIHARKGYRWHHPCHEYPTPDLRITEVWADTDKLLVSHYPDPEKSRGQYLDLLELSVKEDPYCPRNAFYYARELSFYGRWDESIERCQKYLAMPTATWHHERSYAMRVIGKCYERKNENHNAESWYYRAAAEAPGDREPWCELAQLFYNQGRWLECYSSAMKALSIKNRELVYTCDPSAWGEKPHDLAAIAAWHLGMKDIAREQGELAVKLNPEDKRLQENLLWFRGEKGS